MAVFVVAVTVASSPDVGRRPTARVIAAENSPMTEFPLGGERATGRAAGETEERLCIRIEEKVYYHTSQVFKSNSIVNLVKQCEILSSCMQYLEGRLSGT